MKKKRVAVFGSTGSVGRSTLAVIAHLSDRFEVCALAARDSAGPLVDQARRFGVRRLVLLSARACSAARDRLGSETRVDWGLNPLIDVASSSQVDILVMAMSGTVGLLPVLAALEHGKRVAIATKEILVGFGEHVVRLAKKTKAQVLPVDSELAALHQCLDGRPGGAVRRIVLTASGGPFWRAGPRPNATRSQVLNHPTWRMGPKITVDSATLMNKGLEVIETARLFGLGPERLDAVIHPQSVVHALAEFCDGSTLAQLAVPDMRLPIQYCLTYPERLPSLAKNLDLVAARSLEFHPINPRRFPCYALARRALVAGGAAPCVLSAANEVAVQAFLSGRIAFRAIPSIISLTLQEHLRRSSASRRTPDVTNLLRAESWAVSHARNRLDVRPPGKTSRITKTQPKG